MVHARNSVGVCRSRTSLWISFLFLELTFSTERKLEKAIEKCFFLFYERNYFSRSYFFNSTAMDRFFLFFLALVIFCFSLLPFSADKLPSFLCTTFDKYFFFLKQKFVFFFGLIRSSLSTRKNNKKKKRFTTPCFWIVRYIQSNKNNFCLFKVVLANLSSVWRHANRPLKKKKKISQPNKKWKKKLISR